MPTPRSNVASLLHSPPSASSFSGTASSYSLDPPRLREPRKITRRAFFFFFSFCRQTRLRTGQPTFPFLFTDHCFAQLVSLLGLTGLSLLPGVQFLRSRAQPLLRPARRDSEFLTPVLIFSRARREPQAVLWFLVTRTTNRPPSSFLSAAARTRAPRIHPHSFKVAEALSSERRRYDPIKFFLKDLVSPSLPSSVQAPL